MLLIDNYRTLQIFDRFGFIPRYQVLILIMILFRTLITQIGSYERLFLEKSKFLNILILIIMTTRRIILIFRAPILIYIIFEFASIPIFIIIIGWGYQPEKIKAAFIILIYTIISAVPLLFLLLIKTSISYRINLSYLLILNNVNNTFLGSLFRIIIFLSFLVKIPLYGLHFWLPIAHVEAPVYASIILARILLKLGGIGLLRFYPSIYRFFSLDSFSRISLWGSILVGFICLTTTDLKKVIAYTRVAHIALRIILWSLRRSIWLIPFILSLVTHAFSSSGLFYSAHVLYKERNRRIILINTGILSKDKSFRFYFLILVLARVGAPPSINLLREIISLSIISIRFMPVIFLLLSVIILIRAVHFILYSTISQSFKTWEERSELLNCSMIDYFILISHVVVIIFTPLVITFISI